ncbi:MULTISPECIES: STAS domain-containing protein [Sorangium]|uniref:STAS domain-containing protein n=1 Tax=Sorangium TaxID=39643 RepID=UPI003D9C60F8
MDEPGTVRSIELNRMSITWELDQGRMLTFGNPAVTLWLRPSLERLFQPLVAEMGIPLFRLLVAHESSAGAGEDYRAMVTTLGSTFEEGFLAWGACVSASGWGSFALPVFDTAARRAVVIVKNPWELAMQRELTAQERWGCPFLQGKIIGIFSHAFGVNCWADEVGARVDGSSSYIELHVHADDRTIPDEIAALRGEQRAEAQRRLAEVTRTLRESEERQRAILSSISEVVFTLDPEGRFTSYHVPEELADVYAPGEAVLGRTLDEVFPRRSADAMRAALAQVLSSGRAESLSYERVHNGEVRFFSARMSVLRGSGRAVAGATVIERDLSERLAAERALAERVEIIARQQETIRALSTPVLEVWEGVLALPIVGAVDSQRAAAITEDVLGALVRTQARCVILDLTGVEAIDAATADHFAKITRAVALLGAESRICGIRPAVATAMAAVDAAPAQAKTYSTMRSALMSAIRPSR